MKMSNVSTTLFTLFTTAVLVAGWWQKDEFWYTPERGWGYAFGIIGCSMMVLLLLYPARKYWKPMRHFFKVHHWFRLHMVFGVWGPGFILLHSNFSLGSRNSTIALFSMLLVAGSGLFGRYIYQKLHRGLYGKQIEFSELNADYQQSKAHFKHSPFFNEDTRQILAQIETDLTQGLVPLSTCIRAKRKIRKLKRTSKKALRQPLFAARSEAADWFKGLAKLNNIARHAFYTRLFSLWHFLHMPIFIMMLLTATVHIFVVHIY